MLSNYKQITKFFGIYNHFSTTPKQLKNVAVIFHGCGVFDGTECTEGVSTLIALGARGITFQVFAPNKNQAHVLNHLTGEEINQERNVMVESARIARGQVKDLKDLKASDYDAVFVPGGFGAAKNLCDFGFKGADMSVDPGVEAVLRDFHQNKKPVALACISPIIAAKVFGSQGVTLTLGNKGDGWPYQGSIDAAQGMGANVELKNIEGVSVDKKNLVFSAPAFMKDTFNFYEVYQSIDNLVGTVNDTIKSL